MPLMPLSRPPADLTYAEKTQGTVAPPAETIHARVLSVVAARICTDCGQHEQTEACSCLDMLCESAFASETALDQALGRLRSRHGVTDEEIVDSYIPAVACRIGTEWTENRRSFTEVTIATARLIATVRELGRRWSADRIAGWRGATMALIVPEAEQHRLGAMIAATRFRRLGVSVQMLLGRSDGEVIEAVRNGAFDMISFSLATRERVEQTRRLIQMLRDTVRRLPPVVVGGAIGVGSEELKAQLGADHVVSDPEHALRLCGVSLPKRGVAAPGPTA